MGYQALGHLLDSFLRLSLLRERPAAQKRTERYPVRETLLRGKTDGGFSTLLGSTHLAAALMEEGSSTQGRTQAKGVCALLRQCHRLLALRQPLIRRAKQPQRLGGMAVVPHHTSVASIEERSGAVLLGVVECHTLCVVRERRGYRAQVE
jgi:hypothetical protein